MSRPRVHDCRQREWQLKQLALGNCRLCGRPRNLYRFQCDPCQEKVRELDRERKRRKKKAAGSGNASTPTP